MQIVSVEGMLWRAKRGANFHKFLWWRQLVHGKIKLLFFQECVPNTTSLSFSSDVASRRLLSYKVREMNINIGLKSVAALAATATMVPTPLQYHHMKPCQYCNSDDKGNDLNNNGIIAV